MIKDEEKDEPPKLFWILMMFIIQNLLLTTYLFPNTSGELSRIHPKQ